MRNDLLVQYGAMRETIKSNVEIIRKLLTQAESLKKIIENLGDAAAKETLKKEVDNIEDSISDLIDKTDQLFDKYEEFVKTVFTK